MLPAGKQRGCPTGGGNFYLFKKTHAGAAARPRFKFIKWIDHAASARRSGASTPATSRCAPDAWETPAMKQYVAGFPPAAVARDQLQYAVAELSTHDNQRVTKALNDGLQAALTGTKTPEQAMKDAQREAERILQRYKREPADGRRRRLATPPRTGRAAAMTRTAQWLYGWLLLLPAAVLLALFTHYPALATLWHSFFSTPKGARPARLRRPRQLPAARRRPDLLAGAREQRLVSRSARSRLSIALALADGGAGSTAGSPGAASCAWPTSRRRCCR